MNGFRLMYLFLLFVWPKPIWDVQPLAIDSMLGDIRRRQNPPVNKAALAEINQKPYLIPRDCHIADHLSQVAVVKALESLNLYHQLFFYHEIGYVITDQSFPVQVIVNFIKLL